jgi:hypothetical protein
MLNKMHSKNNKVTLDLKQTDCQITVILNYVLGMYYFLMHFKGFLEVIQNIWDHYDHTEIEFE